MSNKPIIRNRVSEYRPVREWIIPNPHYNPNTDHKEDVWWLHNEDGPAMLLYDENDDTQLVCEVWMQYGQHYRLDGPTIIFYDAKGEVVLESWHHFDQEYASFDEWLDDAPLPKDEKVKLKLLYG